MLSPNRSVILSKALKQVESLSNESRIKFEFDQTLPNFHTTFPLFSRKLDHVKTVGTLCPLLFDFCLTFVPHLLNECWAKVDTV